jgi:3',5'-cyclic AMP phosphodiesterase CpdA
MKKPLLLTCLFLATLGLVLGLQAVQAQNPVLSRGPYLQSVTESSIIVCWETNTPDQGAVDYGLTEDYSWTTTEEITTTRHAITLTELSPYTLYHYRIKSGAQYLSDDHTFKTAAGPEQTAFRFAVLGDTRSDHVAHQSVADRIAILAPDFYLHTGDLVANGARADQWDTFFEVEKEPLANIPFSPILGNHEVNHQNYFDLFYLPHNERWYSFDYGNAHFVGLEVDGYASYDPASEQYHWLKNDLEGTDRLWKFVFFHIPPYSSGPHGSDARVRDALAPLFEWYGVDIVFNGHDHDYERSVVNGVTYIVSGGGGAPLYPRKYHHPWTVYFVSALHCVEIAVEGAVLNSVGFRPDGTQFDPFTLRKEAFIPYVAARGATPDSTQFDPFT